MNTPQIVTIIWLGLGVFLALMKNGQRKPESICRYDFTSSLLGFIITILLLNWGGFFNG